MRGANMQKGELVSIYILLHEPLFSGVTALTALSVLNFASFGAVMQFRIYDVCQIDTRQKEPASYNTSETVLVRAASILF